MGINKIIKRHEIDSKLELISGGIWNNGKGILIYKDKDSGKVITKNIISNRKWEYNEINR